MANMLWNPDQDSKKLVAEWTNGVYGKAAPPMRQWFDLLQQKARDPKQHFQCYTDINAAAFLTPEVLKRGDELFDQAEKLAAGDAIASEYVAKNRLCLRYVKLMKNPTTGPEFKSFVADCRKFGIAQISEGKSLDQWEKERAK